MIRIIPDIYTSKPIHYAPALTFSTHTPVRQYVPYSTRGTDKTSLTTRLETDYRTRLNRGKKKRRKKEASLTLTRER